MAIPKLYQAKTQMGIKGQRFFEMHGQLADWSTMAMADQPMLPDTEIKVTHIPVRVAEINTDRAGILERFNLLGLRMELLPRRQAINPVAVMEYRLEYALDPELEQLFDFLQYERTLRHENEMARMQNKLVDHVTCIADKNLQIDSVNSHLNLVHNELARLKRPWYLKIWHSITGA